MANESGDQAVEGQSRRDLLKKGAIAGGVAIWGAPVIQTIVAGPAAAASGYCRTSVVNITDLAVAGPTGLPARRYTFSALGTVTCDTCNTVANSDKYLWDVTNATNAFWVDHITNTFTVTRVDVTSCAVAASWRVKLTRSIQCKLPAATNPDPVLSCQRTIDYSMTPGGGGTCTPLAPTLVSTSCPALP